MTPPTQKSIYFWELPWKWDKDPTENMLQAAGEISWIGPLYKDCGAHPGAPQSSNKKVKKPGVGVPQE